MSTSLLWLGYVLPLIGFGFMARATLGTTIFIALIPLAVLIHLWRDQ